MTFQLKIKFIRFHPIECFDNDAGKDFAAFICPIKLLFFLT